MNKNVGGFDRLIRVALGLGALSLVFVGPQTPLGWVGLIPLVTGAAGWCPLYKIAGFNSCRACAKDTTK